jgi:hypothetical protein
LHGLSYEWERDKNKTPKNIKDIIGFEPYNGIPSNIMKNAKFPDTDDGRTYRDIVLPKYEGIPRSGEVTTIIPALSGRRYDSEIYGNKLANHTFPSSYNIKLRLYNQNINRFTFDDNGNPRKFATRISSDIIDKEYTYDRDDEIMDKVEKVTFISNFNKLFNAKCLAPDQWFHTNCSYKRSECPCENCGYDESVKFANDHLREYNDRIKHLTSRYEIMKLNITRPERGVEVTYDPIDMNPMIFRQFSTVMKIPYNAALYLATIDNLSYTDVIRGVICPTAKYTDDMWYRRAIRLNNYHMLTSQMVYSTNKDNYIPGNDDEYIPMFKYYKQHETMERFSYFVHSYLFSRLLDIYSTDHELAEKIWTSINIRESYHYKIDLTNMQSEESESDYKSPSHQDGYNIVPDDIIDEDVDKEESMAIINDMVDDYDGIDTADVAKDERESYNQHYEEIN